MNAEGLVVASLEGLDASSDASSTRDTHSSSSPTPSTGNGTGVFIPACILDGSAMTNPVIAAKFPRRQRRGSAPPCHPPAHGIVPDAAKQQNISPSSRSDSAATPAAAVPSSSHERPHEPRSHGSRGGRHHGSSHSAKNPFAATPKNIRQQQLLCNLMAAADSFPETMAAAAAVGGSRGPSLDYGAMGPAGRASMDMASMPRAASRGSLDSYGWGYLNNGRNSCDMRQSMDSSYVGARQSMDSYAGTSMRTSMDQSGTWSGRPSVDSTFSCYAPPAAAAASQLFAQQQAAAAAATAAAAVAARTSLDVALPPVPASSALNRFGMWQPGRGSCDLSSFGPAAAANSAFACCNMDTAIDCHAAAAAAAAAAVQMERQRSIAGLLRHESNSISNMSAVSAGSADSGGGGPASPAPSPADMAAAAMMAARCTQMAQFQQIIDSMSGANRSAPGISAETGAALAALTAQGIAPEAAALLLLEAKNAAASSVNGGSSAIAPEAVLFQQQLQQIMNANNMAASAVQAAVASKLYTGSMGAPQQQRQQQQQPLQWQGLGGRAMRREGLREQEDPLSAAVSASNLQQQLELLQRMQL